MKVTFYKNALKEQGLTPTDKIVFSQILYLSLMNEDSRVAFDDEGNFTIDAINEDYGGFVPISWRVSEKYLSEILNISLKQSYLSFKSLYENGYITTNRFGEKLVKLIEIIPFFELIVDSGLKGYELIVYSYLADKIKKYRWVDKYHDAMAIDLNLSFMCLEKTIQRLYEKGFLDRMRKGHQVLLRTKK